MTRDAPKVFNSNGALAALTKAMDHRLDFGVAEARRIEREVMSAGVEALHGHTRLPRYRYSVAVPVVASTVRAAARPLHHRRPLDVDMPWLNGWRSSAMLEGLTDGCASCLPVWRRSTAAANSHATDTVSQ